MKVYDGTPYVLRVTVKCEECEKDMFAESRNVEDAYLPSTVSFMRSDLCEIEK